MRINQRDLEHIQILASYIFRHRQRVIHFEDSAMETQYPEVRKIILQNAQYHQTSAEILAERAMILVKSQAPRRRRKRK